MSGEVLETLARVSETIVAARPIGQRGTKGSGGVGLADEEGSGCETQEHLDQSQVEKFSAHAGSLGSCVMHRC